MPLILKINIRKYICTSENDDVNGSLVKSFHRKIQLKFIRFFHFHRKMAKI